MVTETAEAIDVIDHCLHQNESSDYTSYCLLTLITTNFFSHLNRTVPITIAIFRYILVCRAETAERFGKTKWVIMIMM